MLYFDYNSNSPLTAVARKRALEVLEVFGNPSSVHRAGRRCRKILEEAREQVAGALSASTEEVIFTSGGTEANHRALSALSVRKHALVSGAEHPSILEAVGFFFDHVHEVPLDSSGRVQLLALQQLLEKFGKEATVIVQLASHETGVIQPLEAIVRLCCAREALLHCDAMQGVGKYSVSFRSLGVTTLSVAAHKIGGLAGAGALLVKKNSNLSFPLLGGGQEGRKRPGTQNLVGIAAFGAAMEHLGEHLSCLQKLRPYREAFEKAIKAFAPSSCIFGQQAPRLPHVSCLSMPSVPSDLQVQHMDLKNIAVSAGPACSGGEVPLSSTLMAMGVREEVAKTALRISAGHQTQPIDWKHLQVAWQDLYTFSRGF